MKYEHLNDWNNGLCSAANLLLNYIKRFFADRRTEVLYKHGMSDLLKYLIESARMLLTFCSLGRNLISWLRNTQSWCGTQFIPFMREYARDGSWHAIAKMLIRCSFQRKSSTIVDGKMLSTSSRSFRSPD